MQKMVLTLTLEARTEDADPSDVLDVLEDNVVAYIGEQLGVEDIKCVEGSACVEVIE